MIFTKLQEYKADLLLLSVAIAWGVTFLMVQEAIDTTPVYSFLFFRFSLASIIMFFIAYKYFKYFTLKTFLYGLFLGVFLFSAFATQTFGLAYTTSSIVAFITGLNVIIVPFLAYLLFKDYIRLNVFIATLLAVTGLYLLTMSGTLSFEKGEFLTLICAALFALQIIFTGKFSKEVNVFLLVLIQLTTVSILSLIFSLFIDNTTFNIPYNYAFFKAVIITAVFATVYAFLIQTYMQQFTTATKTAIIFTMEPVSAGIFGYFVANEILTTTQLVGATIIIFATLLAEIKLKKENYMNLFAVFILTIAMFIWGSSFIALKIAMQDLGALTVIFFRMLIASLCFVYFIKSFLQFNFNKKNIKLLLLLAFFEPCLYFIFEAKALQLTTVSQAGMITSLLPIIVGVAAGYFLKEKITLKLIIGALIALSGAVLLSSNATISTQAPNPALGNFFEFLAMACGAGYTIVARYLTKEFSALFITAFQVFIGVIFFFPMFIYETITMEMNYTFNAISSLFYLGVVVTLGGYGLYNYALTKIEASKAAIFIYLIPIFSLILANLILHEKITILELVASGIILFGVFVSEFPINKFIKRIYRIFTL